MGSFVRELDELRAPREGWRGREHVDEGNDGDDPAAAARARRHRGRVEVVGHREERGGFVGVEQHLLALVVEEGERRRGHTGNVPARPR